MRTGDWHALGRRGRDRMNKQPLEPQSKFLWCPNLPTVLALPSSRLGPGCIWERAHGRAAARVAGMTLGSWRGWGGSPAGREQGPVPHRCRTQGRGDVGHHAVSYTGMGANGQTPGTEAQTPEAQPKLSSASRSTDLPGRREQHRGLYFPPRRSCLP